MNLGEYADYVCSKIRETDSDSLAAAKDYLSKRYQLIYQKDLWRDSLIEFTVDVSVANTLNAGGFVQLPRIVDRIVACRTPDRELTVENQEIYFRQTSDQFALSGTPLAFNILGRLCWQGLSVAALTVACASEADNNSSVKVRWIDENSELQNTVVQVTTVPVIIGNGFVVEAFTKNTSTSTVSIYADAVAVLTLAAAATSYDPFHRVRLIQKPIQDFTLRVLAKKKFSPLVLDTDEPFLLDVDNCLIAFGQADMLERQRQYGKSQSKMTEALGLLEQIAKIENEQQASNPRLIPYADGVTPGTYEYESKGYW